MITEQDKDLLLKDLCARLPYGVVCKISNNEDIILKDIFIDGVVGNKGQLGFGTCKYGRIFQELEEVKPYLRTMSSMTEEEYKEYDTKRKHVCDEYNRYCFDSAESIDWLNAYHFDFRGLIEKGLALEAPEDMYKID